MPSRLPAVAFDDNDDDYDDDDDYTSFVRQRRLTTNDLCTLNTYIFRPPGIVIGGLRFYLDSSSFSIFYLFSSAAQQAR